MVEQEQPPRSVDRSGLFQRAGSHGAGVLRRLSSVAERGVGFANCAEGGGVELDGDRSCAVIDSAVPLSADRGETSETAEDSIVVRKDVEPALVRSLGGIEISGAKLELSEPVMKPRNLLAGQVVTAAHLRHGHTQQPTRSGCIAGDLSP